MAEKDLRPVVREGESVCPRCFMRIPSKMVEQDSMIFMEKTCPDHGTFSVPISRYAWYFIGLRSYYDALVARNEPPDAKEQAVYTLFLNMRCNMNCPICFTDANRDYKEPDLEFIEKSLEGMRGVQINLFGGEPTVRDDLPEIIRIVRKSGNIPLLFTNGLKLADIDYLRSMKEAGLEEVHLQFDGFEEAAYLQFRQQRLVDTKVKVLENLKELDIATVLETTIARDVNADQLNRILDYAVRNDFIKAVAFRSYSVLGKAGLGPDSCFTLEDLVDLLDLQTNGRINLRDVFFFQRMLFAFFHILGISNCFYNHYYLLYRREDGGYDTISDLVDIDELEYDPEDLKTNPPGFIARLLPRFTSTGARKVMWDILVTMSDRLGYQQRFHYSQHRHTRHMLVLGFEKACDRFTFDFEHVSNCPGGEITTTEGVTTSFSLGNIKRDKKAVQQGRSGPNATSSDDSPCRTIG